MNYNSLQYFIEQNDIENFEKAILMNKNQLNTLNQFGETLLMSSVYSKGKFSKILIRNGIDLEIKNQNGDTALLLNCQICWTRQNIIKYLIKNNANVNVQNNFGYTPLMYAIENNCIDVVSMLLKYGAKTNLKNKKNKTVFDIDSNNLIKKKGNMN